MICVDVASMTYWIPASAGMTFQARSARFSQQPASGYFACVISTSGSQVAISGNTVISAIASTIMQKNGIEA